ncbi:MAG: hypothetical protein OK457_07705 [Thaumarchaeota archaeon]|nr:hypothetical protein [Nitrososphaerota archaeon]
MKSESIHRIKIGLSFRQFFSTGIAVIALFVLISRALHEINVFTFNDLLLKVEAKCPGLPFGGSSNGPDYIDLAIDGSLAVVAAVFIALTIRDLRRRRRLGPGGSESSEQEGGDEL